MDEWTLRIEHMPIELSVGIYPHEQAPQALLVSVEAHGLAPADPSDLTDCLDYEPLCLWLQQTWPKTSHVPLLETRVNELFAFLFDSDARIHTATVGLYKEQMRFGARCVGIERKTTRQAFEGLSAKLTP